MTHSEALDALGTLHEWAKEKIRNGSEPPWGLFQYMKLIEVSADILDAEENTITLEESLESDQRQDGALQLVDDKYQPKTSRRRRVGLPVQMPM